MKIKTYLILAMLLFGMESVFAQTVLTGNVTETDNGKRVPLPGTNVNIVNAQNRSIGGTIAGGDGNYRLVVPSNERNLTIVYSFIGKESKSFPYTGQQVLNVHLENSAEIIDEVEVVGRRIDRNDMGISQREQVSATQKVMMEDLIATSPVTSIEEALQGALGGLDIITDGGDPGARSTMRIWGTSSLNASSEPLIVINGVPYTNDIDDEFDFSTANDEDLSVLLNISPADIESIEVLKDAAATAIWGSQGRNGVLVITTKKRFHRENHVLLFIQVYSQVRTLYDPDAQWESVSGLDAGGHLEQCQLRGFRQFIHLSESSVQYAGNRLRPGLDLF